MAASPLDYLVFHAGRDRDRDIWEAANQYPLDAGARRLVCVREAHLVRSWGPLLDWIGEAPRLLPTVHLLFVSADRDLDTKTAHQAVIRDRGIVIRCAPPNEDDTVAWVLRAAGDRLTELTGRHLLARVGGDLEAARNVARKLAYFDGHASTDVIDALVAERRSADLVDLLIMGDKPAAFRAATVLPEAEIGMVIGSLDARLDVLGKLHGMLRRRMSPGEIARDKSVPTFLARLLESVTRDYDPGRITRSRTVLAVIDDHARVGVRAGLLEALVSLW